MVENAFGSYCPECLKEAQNRQQQEIDEQIAEERQQARQVALSSRFDAIQIGRRFAGKAWSDYHPPCKEAEKALALCVAYADRFRSVLETGASMALLGNPGTGKNMLAALIAMEIHEAGYTALHTSAAKMVRMIKDSWKTSRPEQEVMDSFKNPDLLIINEVGVQFGSKSEENYLTEIIDDRYEDLKPTIIISNEKPDRLEKFIGVRALDRFYEKPSCVVAFTWSSYRRCNVQKS